jgi:hypothetical protein
MMSSRDDAPSGYLAAQPVRRLRRGLHELRAV